MKRWSLKALILCLLFTGCDSGREEYVFANPDPIPPVIEPDAPLQRKRVSDLTLEERERFVTAVKAMKQIPSNYEPDVNAYDYFVVLHQSAFDLDSRAHMHPNFLPWHREFLLRFERELQRAGNDDTLFIPYWDWAHPGEFESVFASDFMGGNGSMDEDFAVTDGPFRKGEWDIVLIDLTPDEHLPEAAEAHGHHGHHERALNFQSVVHFGQDHEADLILSPGPLQRNMGDPRAFFPNNREVFEAISIYRPYDSPPFDTTVPLENSFRNYLEGWWERGSSMHNGIHVFIGGQMGSGTSPNDPVFFLHHAQVDRIWALYQEMWGNESYPEQFLDEQLFEFPGVTVRSTFDLEGHSNIVYR